MRHALVSLLLAVSVGASLGCAKPDLDPAKVRIGMAKKEALARLGNPTRSTVAGDLETLEYEAYDRYGALIVNRRSQFVRLRDGRVEAVGTREELAALGSAPASLPVQKAAPGPEGARHLPSSAAFDLRTELEKLEKLKRDGLISESEFKELRQRVLDKAKAQ